MVIISNFMTLDQSIPNEAVRVLMQVENIAKLEHETSEQLREIDQKNYYIATDYKAPQSQFSLNIDETIN